MRTCTGCSENLPVENFYRRNDQPISRCKDCCRARSHAVYVRNPEPYKRRAEEQRARLRVNRQPRIARTREEDLAIRRQRARLVYAENPQKFRDKAVAWQHENPEVPREHARRRRARLLAAPVVEFINRGYVWERDGGRCHICAEAADPENFHLDHLIPLSKGGDHSHLNVRVAHPVCNMRRGAGRLPAQLLLVA